jgi:hypothetical protein
MIGPRAGKDFTVILDLCYDVMLLSSLVCSLLLGLLVSRKLDRIIKKLEAFK